MKRGVLPFLFTGHCTGRRFHAGSMKIPRQAAPYGAGCSISVHREACYCSQATVPEGVFMPVA